MNFYLPSWNGDFRLEAVGEKSALVLHEPTENERIIIGKFLHEAHRKDLFAGADPGKGKPYLGSELRLPLSMSIEKASKLLIKHARPKDRTLTAVKFADGKMEITEGATSEALEKIESDTSKAKDSKGKDKPAGVSVKRATPCCPSCMPGAIEPATEVLLSFLTPEQHETWKDKRVIIVEGELTGHRYLLAHRHSAFGQKVGRICYDLDDSYVVHFHDWSVPPEEEVLGAKLVLENREAWLRNEATCFSGYARDVFKNPFGDVMDGTESSGFAMGFGDELLRLLSPLEKKRVLREFTV